MTKTELYRLRCNEHKHNGRMYIDNAFFTIYCKKEDAQSIKTEVIRFCKSFNKIAIEYTGDPAFEIILNRGIPETAADFKYQYDRIIALAGDRGDYHEIHNQLAALGLKRLYDAIIYPKRQGYLTFEIEEVKKVLTEIKGNPLAVLVCMKMHCSKPTGPNGVTGISDTRIAEELGINRTSVYRARFKLVQSGLITELSKEKISTGGKFVTYSKYSVNI